MIYLASPYSAPTWRQRYNNYLSAMEYTSFLMEKKICVFSPIVHCHNIATQANLPKDFDFWMEIDKQYINVSHELRVLMLKGWRQSKGVSYEIDWANHVKTPITYVSPDEPDLVRNTPI